VDCGDHYRSRTNKAKPGRGCLSVLDVPFCRNYSKVFGWSEVVLLARISNEFHVCGSTIPVYWLFSRHHRL
jgi:hypothetical protein